MSMTIVTANICRGGVEGSLDVQEDSSPISPYANVFSQVILIS